MDLCPSLLNIKSVGERGARSGLKLLNTDRVEARPLCRNGLWSPFGIETGLTVLLAIGFPFVGMACGARSGLKPLAAFAALTASPSSEWPVEPVWD